MRLALPHSLPLTIPLRRSLTFPRGDRAGILLIFMLGFQPFGSMPALMIFVMAMALLIVTTPMHSRVVVNWLSLSAYLGAVALCLSPFISINFPLFSIYFLYGSGLVATFHVLSTRMRAWSVEDLRMLVNWMLALDIAVNAVPVAIELAMHGIGDYVTGLSGLLIKTSLSQNRTYSVKAGFLLVLAVANYRAQRNSLSAASICFNLFVLLIGVSVTTILALIIALGSGVIFRRNPFKALLALFALVPLAFAANYLNQANGSSDVFDMIININTHYVPKIDMYKQYFTILIGEYPWLPLFGNGFGNTLNRFALLANFQGSSNFQGKEFFSAVLEAPFISRHLVDHYNLNYGIVGNSIISVPWSSIAGLILEWGLVGIVFATALAWPALKTLWNAGSGSLVGSGRFLLIFLAGNMFWDCYLDYPEVMIPFFICALALSGLDRSPSGIEKKQVLV